VAEVLLRNRQVRMAMRRRLVAELETDGKIVVYCLGWKRFLLLVLLLCGSLDGFDDMDFVDRGPDADSVGILLFGMSVQ